MAKVLGFTIEIQGQQKVIDTTNQLKEALKQIKDEMGKTSDAKDYEKLAKEAAKLTNELTNVNKQQREYNKELQNSKNAAGSYNALNAELVKLRQSYKALSEAERNGPAGKDALKRIGELDTQLKKLDAGMGNFQRNVGNYPQTIIGALQTINPAIGNVASNFNELIKSTNTFSKVIAGGFAIGGLLALTAPLVQAANSAEQAKINFNALNNSVVEGTQLYSDLISISQKTPFELKDLQQNAKQLLAYGFSASEVTKQIQVLGDISAGVGTDKLPNLILALGQVKAAGRLTGNELRQFTESGVNLLQQLALDGGKSISQVKKDIEDGKISFQETANALQKMTEQGGTFFGLMEKQSKSLAGQWSNLKDSAAVLAADLGSVLLPVLKNLVGGANLVAGAIKKLFNIQDTQKQVQNIADFKNEFNSLINQLIKGGQTDLEKSNTISIIMNRFPEWTKGVDLTTASTKELNKVLIEGNKLAERKLDLSNRQKKLDEDVNTLKNYGEILEKNKKVTDKQILSSESFQQTLRQLPIDMDNLNKSIIRQRGELETLTKQYEKDAGLSTNIAFGAVGGKTKKGKTPAELKKEANDAIIKAENDFLKEMVALTKQIEDARVKIIEDSYQRELAAIEKSMSDKIDAYNKERDERLEINKETEAKIIAAFGANSKQLADFKKQVDDEDKAFTQRRYELDILLFEERNRLIADLDKKYADKAKAEREKAFNERLQQTNKYYDNQNKISQAKSNEAIAILQNASNDEQEAVEDNEKAKIKIRRKYDNLIRAEQIKQLEIELAAEQARKFAIEKAYEQSGVKLEGGAPTADAVAAIGNIEKQISALRAKGVKTNEKYNKEEVAADKKLMDEKVKNAVAAMQVIQDFASQVGSFIDELNQRQIARMEEQITAHQDKLSQLQEEMTNTTGAQRVELQRQIDNEKAALDEATQQKAEAEKKAAKEHQRIALIQAIIDTASAIIANAVKNPFAAVAAGILGGVQIATIAAQAFADGGKVLSGEKIRNKPNIRMRNGDNVLATVRTGEVILNERQQARLGGAKTFRRIGVPGFASGGMVGDVLPRPTEDFLQNATQSIQTNNEIKALVKAMDARFDRLQVHVVGEDVANELNNQARAKKAAVI